MLPKPKVHEFAEAVASHLGYVPGHPLEPLLAKIGGSLAYRALFTDKDNADSIQVEPSGIFTIYVSGLTSTERERFTIAHELGHYFLHFPIFRKKHPDTMMVATRWVDDTDQDQRRAEWEANWFAAAFLMPARQFKEQYEACGRDINELAARFGVSIHAAGIRIESI